MASDCAHIRIIDNWQDFEQLQSIWDTLLQQSDANCLFLSWDWINCWRLAARQPITPHIVVIEQDSQVIAIAPFYIQKYKLLNCIPYHVLRYLADAGVGSEYGNFIVASHTTTTLKLQLWQALLQPASRGKWDIIWLSDIASWTPGGQSLICALQQVAELKYHTRAIAFAATDLTGIDKQVLPSLSKSLRTNIRQTRRQLDNLGQLSIVLSQDVNELPQHLQKLFQLHNKRWQAAGLSGSFARRPELMDFYNAFTAIALQRDQLRLLRLDIDGKTKALQLGYVYNGSFLAMQEGFDPDFIAGTGQVLRHAAFLQCQQEQLDEYDFLGIYTNHKRRWLAAEKNGCQLFIWQDKLKNTPFNFTPIWPTGRFLTAYDNE